MKIPLSRAHEAAKSLAGDHFCAIDRDAAKILMQMQVCSAPAKPDALMPVWFAYEMSNDIGGESVI